LANGDSNALAAACGEWHHPPAPGKTTMLKGFLIFVAVVILAVAGFTAFTLSWAYSEGERAGYVQKLSKKGWICKTWEGEMAMVTMPGTVAEKFYFTVREDDVAAKINATVGTRVVLTYEEHKWIPFSCFGDTGYFVNGVRPAGVEPMFLERSPAA
jgi:hypothetical protein